MTPSPLPLPLPVPQCYLYAYCPLAAANIRLFHSGQRQSQKQRQHVVIIKCHPKKTVLGRAGPMAREIGRWPVPTNKSFYYTRLLTFFQDQMSLFVLK
jgi:hypothetical protein